jgi:hypothetical protein
MDRTSSSSRSRLVRLGLADKMRMLIIGPGRLVVSDSNCEAPVGAALRGRPLLRRSATGRTNQYYPTPNFLRAPLAGGQSECNANQRTVEPHDDRLSFPNRAAPCSDNFSPPALRHGQREIIVSRREYPGILLELCIAAHSLTDKPKQLAGGDQVIPVRVGLPL